METRKIIELIRDLKMAFYGSPYTNSERLQPTIDFLNKLLDRKIIIVDSEKLKENLINTKRETCVFTDFRKELHLISNHIITNKVYETMSEEDRVEFEKILIEKFIYGFDEKLGYKEDTSND